MAASEQEDMQLHITKQSAQGCWGKVIRPYTIDSRSASRHHTDSLGASTAREKGTSAGPAHRRRDCGTLYAIWYTIARPSMGGENPEIG